MEQSFLQELSGISDGAGHTDAQRFRPVSEKHGHRLISTGITSLYLNVHIEPLRHGNELVTLPPGSSASEDSAVLRSLIKTFSEHFGSQYPFLRARMLCDLLDAHGEDSFLLNCVAAIAASYSDSPQVVQPGVQPYEYGIAWYRRARSMVGTVMAIPLRETIMGFVLLAAIAVKIGSASEIWMMTGSAVRMAYDLGLHLNLNGGVAHDLEDVNANRLVFWNVLMLDHIVSLGLGRPTTFRLEQVTQTLPDHNSSQPGPFAMAARLMYVHGQLINQLNMDDLVSDIRKLEVTQAKCSVTTCYNSLPPEMQWSAAA